MKYWLVKTEPNNYSWEDLKRDKSTIWDGVRNYQARNFIREMKKGDRVLVYHSVKAREVVGLAEVTKGPYPDPTATKGDWSVVDLKAVDDLPHPVSLAEIKAEQNLQDFLLVRNSRLSVMPVSEKQYKAIMKLSANP